SAWLQYRMISYRIARFMGCSRSAWLDRSLECLSIVLKGGCGDFLGAFLQKTTKLLALGKQLHLLVEVVGFLQYKRVAVGGHDPDGIRRCELEQILDGDFFSGQV